MAERPGLGLAMGIQSGLTALATGIAQRRQRSYDTDQQERAAKAFNEYLRTGQISGDMLNLDPRLMAQLTPQEKAGTPQWVLRPPEGQGPAQLVYGLPQPGDQPYEKPPAEGRDPLKTEFGRLIDERGALPDGDPKRALYDEMIKKRRRGALIQLKQGEGGEYIKYDPETGELLGGTGEYAPPPSEVRLASTYLKDNANSVKEIAKLYDEKFVGPLQGNLQKASALLQDAPEFTAFKAKLGRLMTIIYGFSGKQINEWEKDWLKSDIIPQLTNPQENFKAKLSELGDWLDTKQEFMYKEFPGLSGGKERRANEKKQPDVSPNSSEQFKIIEVK